MRTFDGLELFVRVDGPKDPAEADVTVVLAHCWTSDHDSWRYQLRDLLRRYGDHRIRVRVVSYDHRGHGASDETHRRDATIDNLGRDLADLIDAHAPVGDLLLAGHSIGGMTIMALAERRPELLADRVRGVLFVATSGCDLDTVNLGLPELGERIKGQLPRLLATRSRMLSRRRRRRAPITESLVARRFLFGDDFRLRDHMLAVEGIINTPAASMCGFYEDLMRHDRLEGLSVLAGIPVRVLVGSSDRLTPPAHARRLAEAIPGATLTIAPGAGHMLPLERDQLVTDALADLIGHGSGRALERAVTAVGRPAHA